MGVMEHLGELRTRIIRSLVAIAIGGVAGWFLYPLILDFILEPYCDTLGRDCTLRIDEPLEGLNTRIPAVMQGLVDEPGYLCEEGNALPEVCKARKPGPRVPQQTRLGQDGYIVLNDIGRTTPEMGDPLAEETITSWQAEKRRLLSLSLHLRARRL